MTRAKKCPRGSQSCSLSAGGKNYVSRACGRTGCSAHFPGRGAGQMATGEAAAALWPHAGLLASVPSISQLSANFLFYHLKLKSKEQSVQGIPCTRIP